MKRTALILMACIVAAQATIVYAENEKSGDDRIQVVTFRSNVLGESKRYCVVLPEGYRDHSADWPVLFLLHGRGRNEQSLIDQPDTRAALLSAPFVTVLPAGDDGWYINSSARQQDRYADYTEEVIRHAERRFRLSDDREQRGISGWSMGGYGAVCFAEQHPNRFSAVAPIIGLLDFPRAGLPDGQDYPVPTDRFGENPAQWLRLNPIHAAERLEDMRVLIITADGAFDRTMNENFHHRLTELGIEHRYEVLKGGHSFDVVCEAMPIVVAFMSEAFANASAEMEPTY